MDWHIVILVTVETHFCLNSIEHKAIHLDPTVPKSIGFFNTVHLRIEYLIQTAHSELILPVPHTRQAILGPPCAGFDHEFKAQ